MSIKSEDEVVVRQRRTSTIITLGFLEDIHTDKILEPPKILISKHIPRMPKVTKSRHVSTKPKVLRNMELNFKPAKTMISIKANAPESYYFDILKHNGNPNAIKTLQPLLNYLESVESEPLILENITGFLGKMMTTSSGADTIEISKVAYC
jgi:hypothetical protein